MCDRIADLEFPDKIVEDKKGRKIKNGCPKYGLERRQDLGRDDGGDRNGGIMKTIDVVEYQGQDNNDKEKGHGRWAL